MKIQIHRQYCRNFLLRLQMRLQQHLLQPFLEPNFVVHANYILSLNEIKIKKNKDKNKLGVLIVSTKIPLSGRKLQPHYLPHINSNLRSDGCRCGILVVIIIGVICPYFDINSMSYECLEIPTLLFSDKVIIKNNE